MLQVICIGSATIDMFMTIQHPFKACTAGEKILVDGIDYETGGGGSNAAVALARMGIKVGYFGKLGKDGHAQNILDEFKKEKVKSVPVKRSDKHTAFSVILESSKERDRIIYTHKGATNDLDEKDVSQRRINAEWLYLSSTLGKTLQTTKKIVAQHHGRVLFNPSSYLCRKSQLCASLLAQTNILVVNKKEAQLLTKSKKDLDSLARTLLKRGPKQIIITEGPKGVWYFDEVRKVHVKPQNVKVLSTAGAGDSFTAGFLASLLHGKTVDVALKIGVVNSCSVIQHRGAKNKLLTWNEACIQTTKLKATTTSFSV